jgi:hypothetical protein
MWNKIIQVKNGITLQLWLLKSESLDNNTKIRIKLCQFMIQSPWEVASHSHGQEHSSTAFLLNTQVYYHLHSCQKLVCLFSQLYTVHILCICDLHLRLALRILFYSSCFLVKLLYRFIICPLEVACLDHRFPVYYDHPSNTIYGENNYLKRNDVCRTVHLNIFL